jgi:predicted pyridoxine 5'-phosphate oxidase superfamily flavin-nucleotide-binding protein
MPDDSATANRPSSDVAFTASVRAIQERRGSRRRYQRLEEKGGFRRTITPDLAAFLAERNSFYLATSNAEGQPYIQHRGGPKGFLRVIDETTLAFADFGGNQQFITLGNLADNPHAFIFLMDYAQRRRVKLWGRARVVAGDPALLERLADPAYPGKPEQAILFTIEAWDINCPQHIPQLVAVADLLPVVEKLEARIRELEAKLALRTDGTADNPPRAEQTPFAYGRPAPTPPPPRP